MMLRSLLLVLPLCLVATAAMAVDPQRTERAIEHVRSNAAELGLETGDLDDLVVSDVSESRHSGVQHVYLQQQLEGIAVVNGIINVSLDANGKVVHMGSRFVPGLAGQANTRAPLVGSDNDRSDYVAVFLLLAAAAGTIRQRRQG